MIALFIAVVLLNVVMYVTQRRVGYSLSELLQMLARDGRARR